MIQFLTNQSVQNFAHVMTAMLYWHVPRFCTDYFGTFSTKTKKISSEFKLGKKITLWNILSFLLSNSACKSNDHLSTQPGPVFYIFISCHARTVSRGAMLHTRSIFYQSLRPFLCHLNIKTNNRYLNLEWKSFNYLMDFGHYTQSKSFQAIYSMVPL